MEGEEEYELKGGVQVVELWKIFPWSQLLFLLSFCLGLASSSVLADKENGSFKNKEEGKENNSQGPCISRGQMKGKCQCRSRKGFLRTCH
jgi:hypothetical protein